MRIEYLMMFGITVTALIGTGAVYFLNRSPMKTSAGHTHVDAGIESAGRVSADLVQPAGDSAEVGRNTPPEVLAALAQRGDFSMRSIVARDHNAPPELLARLAEDENELVRWGVATNPHTPQELLALLQADSNEGVRSAVAMNFRTLIVTTDSSTTNETSAEAS